MANQSIYLNEAINVIASVLPRAKEDAIAHVLLNAAINECWQRYNWPYFMRDLTPFWLVPYIQDYPWVVNQNLYPDNLSFWSVESAVLTDLSQDPPYKVDIPPIDSLGETNRTALPSAITYVRSSNLIRIFPRPPNGIGGLWQIECEAKIIPTKVTPTDIYTTLVPLYDTHFMAFVEVLKWCAYRLFGDPRANEQGGIAIMALDAAAAADGIRVPQDRIAPSEGLALGGSSSWGRWGRTL